MNRLRKRRPSSPTRPSTGFSTISSSSSNDALNSRPVKTRSNASGGADGLLGGDEYVEIMRSGERARKDQESALNESGRRGMEKGLPQLNLAPGDFRGSVIIGSLSKRFSVLRFDGPSSTTSTSDLPHSGSTISFHSTSTLDDQDWAPNSGAGGRRDRSGTASDRHHAVVPLPTTTRPLEMSPPGSAPMSASSSSSGTLSPLSPAEPRSPPSFAGTDVPRSASTTSIGSTMSGKGSRSEAKTPVAPPRGPGWPSVSLAEIKLRLATQRQKGGLNHIREEEEDKVLGELMGLGLQKGSASSAAGSGGKSIAWGAQGQGHGVAIGQTGKVDKVQLNLIGGGGLAGAFGDFRSSPTVWGRELEDARRGGPSRPITRSVTAPILSAIASDHSGSYAGGHLAGPSSSSTSHANGMAPSLTLPNIAGNVPRSTSASDVRADPSSVRGYGFSGSGKFSDEKMLVLAMQKKGRKREEARLGADGRRQLEEVGEIRFDDDVPITNDVAAKDEVAGTLRPAGATDGFPPTFAPVAPLKPKRQKRQSYIAGLSHRDVARISKALWEVEDEIFKQLVREIDGEEAAHAQEGTETPGSSIRKSSTDTIRVQQGGGVGEGAAVNPQRGIAEKDTLPQSATPPPRVKRVNSRRKPSITRSPAYHENLAAVAEAELAVETENFGSTGLSSKDLLGSLSNGLPGASPNDAQDVFSAHSMRAFPRSAGSVGVHSSVRPLRKSASGDNLPSPASSEHSRTMSSSAVPINRSAVERGYSPGQARPFTPEKPTFNFDSAPNTPSPTEILGDESLTPPAKLQPFALTRLASSGHKRDASTGLSILPPGQRGGSLLSSSNSSNGLPSVSPVVETFEESSDALNGAYDTLSDPHTLAATTSQLSPAKQAIDPFDVSFDAAGYYGSSSPGRQSLRSTHRVSDSFASSYQGSEVDDELEKLLLGIVDTGSGSPEFSQMAKSNDQSLGTYQEMWLVQEKLIAAARSVRLAMRGGAMSPPIQHQPGFLRARPSVRARKLETTIYDDQDGVSQMVRAMSPRASIPWSSATEQSQSIWISESAPFLARTPVPCTEPDGHASAAARKPSPFIINSVGTGAPQPDAQLAPADQLDPAARARLARALYGSEADTTLVSGHRRTESNVSTGSARLDEDPSVIRDFEERIARANALLQRNRSFPGRVASKGKARVIGAPTLVNTSADVKVTPLKSPEVKKTFSRGRSASSAQPADPPANGIFPDETGVLFRRPSAEGPGTDAEVGGKGFRSFMSKLKRKDSKAKSPALPVSPSPLLPSDMETPTLGSSLKRKPSTAAAAVSHALHKAPSLSRRNRIGLGLEGFDMITPQEASIIAPRPSRNDVVRRTIILANPDMLAVGDEIAARSRKISTRRKPVRYLSDEAEEEKLTSPVIPESRESDRPVSSNSLLEYYASVDDSSSSVVRSASRESTVSRGAIEIREMSDGALVWGVVYGREADAQGSVHAARNASLITDDSSYSQDYRDIIVSGNDHALMDARRPQTQVFYSAPDKVADLVNELSESGHKGNFRIIPTTQEPVEDRLHALISRMKATPK